MESCNVLLFQATDATDSYALKFPSDPADQWRAQSGFGKEFQQVWAIELQSDSLPDFQRVNWDAVLERSIEAFNLSDPVITNFEWPQVQPA